MQAVPDKEPQWKKFTQEIPSTARIETYPWMAPSPGISRYVGHRRLALLDQIKYVVPNVEYDASLSVLNRDIEDDQIGGYMMRVKEFGQKAAVFPGIAVLQNLATAVKTGLPCFDGSNFLSSTHTVGGYPSSPPAGFGGGGNALTFTSSNSSDGVTHTMVFLIHSGEGGLKPLLWQRRKGPDFETNAGTPQSKEAKESHYWCDLEGAPAFGYWWQALSIVITNTPSLLDIFACFDAAMKQLFQFYLPAALPTDPDLYVHQDLEFGPNNTTIVCSTGIWALLMHALNEDRVGVSVPGSNAGITSNIYYGRFGLQQTPYLN